jgi:bifunctional DNA-binding transcriptional regulator/antitoxin component of YhaV-PrlF toxin-antitoxin module
MKDEELAFHARMDARGKIQIPKRECEARCWKPGAMYAIRITKREIEI